MRSKRFWRPRGEMYEEIIHYSPAGLSTPLLMNRSVYSLYKLNTLNTFRLLFDCLTSHETSAIILASICPISSSMKTILMAVSLLLGSLFTADTVSAQQTIECQPIFGGGPSCIQSGDITLDKKLRHPQSNNFVDHLDITDATLSPNTPVIFQLHIRNTSNRAIDDILVTDIMPQHVSFTKGPGTYNKETNILTYTIERLEPGQTQTLTVEGLVASKLPQTNGAVCVVNQATATKARNTSSDNTQFCLGTGVATSSTSQQTERTTPPVMATPNITKAPSTGPELIGLIGLVTGVTSGILLRRKASE